MAEKFLKTKERADMLDYLSNKGGNLVIMAHLVFELADNFEFLELTSELSKIAGCLWETSLKSSRAERNEMLLMHYFWRDGFVGKKLILSARKANFKHI